MALAAEAFLEKSKEGGTGRLAVSYAELRSRFDPQHKVDSFNRIFQKVDKAAKGLGAGEKRWKTA